MTEEVKALLTGRKALLTYLFLLELSTFFGFVSVKATWKGIFDPTFIGPCGSVMILQAIPFFIPKQIIEYFTRYVAENQVREDVLMARAKDAREAREAKDGTS